MARKMWRTLEPYHGLIYFAPEATAAYEALGVMGRDGYFASRAAPMGAVPANEAMTAERDPWIPRLALAAGIALALALVLYVLFRLSLGAGVGEIQTLTTQLTV